MSLIQLGLFKGASNPQNLYNVFNRQFSLVDTLCEEDYELPDVAKRDLKIRSFEPLRLGMTKDQLREEFVLEASYNKDF